MDEEKDNLRSRQYARIVDLISEGPIRGVVNGLQGVILDGTPLQSATTGALAFNNVNVQFVNGYPAQPIMSGFYSQEAETSVNLQLKQATPLLRSITALDADRARVTVSVPGLSNTNTKTGEIDGNQVQYRIEVAPNGLGFQMVGDFTISGKTMSKYQRAHVFGLPGVGPWQIRLSRLTTDEHTSDRVEDTYWDSYSTIIDDRVNYTRRACVGLQIDAEQFGTLPKRTYLTDGLLVLIPNNYDPFAAVNYGPWNGVWAFNWTNNPAWVFYDLVVNNRYGLGSFISPDMVDKWALYKVAVFCDQRVPDGRGAYERRFTCNVQITSQQEAFDLLGEIASIFRGFAYWAGGQLVAVADAPADPIAQYSNANVLDGSFSYAGANIRARHTQASTAFADMTMLGEQRFAVVENRAQMSRFGIQSADDPGFGSTSESQSIRAGKWALYTEEFESEVISFKTGLDTAWVRPGDIIRVSDVTIAGDRMGGRVVGLHAVYNTVVLVDQRPPMVNDKRYVLSCIIPSGNTTIIVTRDAYLWTGAPNGIYITAPFPAPPLADSVFVLNDPVGLQPTLWRVITTKQIENDKYEIEAMRHFPEKWGYIEYGIAFSTPDITNIQRKPPACTNLVVKEYLIQTSPISVGVRANFSWESKSTSFEVAYRKSPGNWTVQRTDGLAIDLPVVEGMHDFRVTAISRIGIKGDPATISKEIIGRFALPPAPKQFRIHVIDGVAMFDWLPVTELDVIIGGYFQLRHTASLAGATWTSAQVVIPRVPGTATSCEATYQPGTWMLRTYDIVERASATWALIVGVQEDTRYVQWARICENPDWLGNHNNTDIRMPQEWLTIKTVNSGYVDDQLAMIDTWTDIDNTPIPPGQEPGPNNGVYSFVEPFDAGSNFSVRLSADILAFPFADPGDWFDDRMTYADTWSNWDDLEGDYEGQVSLQLRITSNDPTDPNAQWGDWVSFTSGEHYGRGFEFRALLSAPPGQNLGVETLCILGDFKSKYDEGGDVPYPGADVIIYYRIKFFNVPAVVITVQDAMDTDRIWLVEKERDYFILRITDNAGVPNQQIRSFDWHASGY
jgi:hypothetical protein